MTTNGKITRSASAEAEALAIMLDLSEDMLLYGADVSLVGSCLRCMGQAYGAEFMDVFVISTLIICTMTTTDGQVLTENRRVDGSSETNMEKIEDLYQVCVDYCKGEMTLAELKDKEKAITKRPFPRFMLYAGGVLSTSCFAIFFGGTLLDGLAAALFSLLVCWMIEKVKPRIPNGNLFSFLAAFVSGIGIAAVCRAVPQLNMSMVIEGVIMVLIPGIMLTNSARDMIAGDVVTGIMSLVESLICATALALGFIAAIWIFAQVGA